MKLILYLVATAFLATTDSSVYENIKEDVLSFLTRSFDVKKPRFEIQTNNDAIQLTPKPETNLYEKRMRLKKNTKKESRNNLKKELESTNYEKSMKLKKKTKKEYKSQKKFKKELEFESTKKERERIDTKTMEHYQLDPVLNFLKRRNLRRSRKHSSESSAGGSSSSLEMEDWKDAWKEHWAKKKFEALNATEPRGDEINMVAARPWGVPCGDPNQHDVPWGTCMLPMECEAEYRIYRGDYFCGRTQFICCALRLTNYDMYQGFEVSFENTDLSTDSEEKKNKGKGSKERSKRKKKRLIEKRKSERHSRKRKIKKNINKIIKEIRKILNRSYRNGTDARKKKTKQLKKFIKDLKKRYKMDRKSVKDIHEEDLIKVDALLMKKLDQIRDVNQNFMKNATFREIIINGSTDKEGARMLVQAYPDLAMYFRDKTRRNNVRHPDYDIEYGLQYQ